ncbi:helix-turn-helix transcriptional regulator [Streptomyces sp. ISL-66]|uniref:winged helix-turn-helix transcriptional regulator n=1 Tax=Streptomyces sp. ISL-66 TaxID=2819186 RepID=UPI001BEB8CAB|nr:helix-turn-helix domain-containing protein [Streptomyces sp. ISL-66]MBT2470607.1 helix-turn-helix transcriptional regulator [Streptomyces sp. ISL-66]
MSAGHTAVTITPGVDHSADLVISCETPQDECGVRDVLDRLGDKWSVYVMVELTGGVRRFKELQRLIPGDISQRMLTLTVRRLERDGLVKRTVYPTIPPQVEYELTDMGRNLSHLIKAIADWSIGHRAPIAEARAAFDARLEAQ